MVKGQSDHRFRASQVLGRFWTAANALSLARAVLVLPIAYLIITDGSLAWIFGLIFVAVLTDWIDGSVARWSHTVSVWGKVLDPCADKFAAAVVVFALVIRGSLPLWFLIFIVARDVLIILGGIRVGKRIGHVVMSMWAGKIAITALAITVLAAVLQADPSVLQFCIWSTTILLIYAYFQYLINFIRLMRSDELVADAIQNQPEAESVISINE